MRIALQPIAGPEVQREREARRAQARPLSELLPMLAGEFRVWAGGEGFSDGIQAWSWPIDRDTSEMAASDQIRPGDRFVFLGEDGRGTVHWVLACGVIGRSERDPPQSVLLLDTGEALDLPASEIRSFLGHGDADDPLHLTVLDEDEGAALDALISASQDPGGALSEQADADPAQADGMDRWYRQGLVAHSDAFRAALRSDVTGDPEILDSLRRLSSSLARRIQTRFPALGEEAAAVAALDDARLVDGARDLLRTIQAEIEVDAPTPVSILVVEDEPTTALLTHRIISAANREFLFAATKAEAEAIIASQRVDVVILDQSLPDADGRDLLAELRAHPRTTGIPVLVLSGKSGPQAKSECFALGADAYFEKPADPTALSAAVSAFLLRSAEIRDQVVRDPLTGLATREMFMRTLADAHVAAARTGEQISLVILDIDRFRAVNDFQGREVGDRVLTSMASALKKSLRRSDLTARWGDDEFAIGLRGTNGANAGTALDKVRMAFAAALLDSEHSGPDGITFSVGAAELGLATSLEEAVHSAELRLVRAGAAGGGHVMLDDDPIARGVQKVLLVEDDQITAQLLDHRLRRDGYEVVHFADGLDALEAAPGTDFSLVVLDVATPGADGFGLLQRLRRTASFATVPIMMLTMERETQVSRAFSLGATDTMRKPFALSEFSARVHGLLSR